jgi:predicted NACHT family NTPase
MSVFVLVSIVLDAQAVVNIAAVVGTLISATTLYMSLSVEPTEENLNSAIIELARLLEDSWGNRMSLLLGRDDDRQAASQPLPACVKFSRLTNLELTSQPNLGSNGNWNTIYAAFYQKIRGGRLVITGDPGHGKTLLAIELVLQILRARNGGGSAENSLPVPVSVAGWDGTEDLPTWLTKRLKEEWHLSPTIGRTLIRRHLILPVLDGLDEIGARQDKEKPLDRQLRVLRRLNPSRGAMKGTEPVPIIVTCRIDDYQLLKKEVGGLLGAVVVKVLPLNRRLIKEYLRARFDPTMTLHTVDGAQ